MNASGKMALRANYQNEHEQFCWTEFLAIDAEFKRKYNIYKFCEG